MHDFSESDLGPSLLTLLTTAAQDNPSASITLSRIAQEISETGAASLLEPLDTLPILLPCKDPAAGEILSSISECGSAKEVVMAIQEAVEHCVSTTIGDDEDESDESDAPKLSITSQLMTLVDLYSACIPRLKLRRKTTSETIKPLLKQLEDAISHLSSHASSEEGRGIIKSVSLLVTRLAAWARSVDNQETDTVKECDKILESLLDCTLTAYEHCIKAFLTQRTLESLYPRLALCSSVSPGWESGNEAVLDAVNAYSHIHILPEVAISAASLPKMIAFAYSGIPALGPSQLTKLLPILISAIQSNSGLDEALAILLRCLDPLKAPPRPYLPEEIIHSLSTLIPPLSSSHPDPLVRHHAFRILSLLLASCPSPIRLQLLRGLTTDEQYPQMRVAAVGLVKEAVLEALSHPPNVFASPAFFDAFGSILFKPNPPGLLTNQLLSIDNLQETSEAARLVECLGTYYTILQRDKNNLVNTHVRNADTLRSVEAYLLSPLRLALNRWESEGHSGFP
ncbi:hypothetical protein H0H92_002418 [Tricholoma furcatifolium]|nr:hypothetical protein H0H92_002418 [Tricholoma furcatifolium]